MIKSKANHKILVNTSNGNQGRSQNFNRGEKTTGFQHLNIFNGPCFHGIFHSSSVFRFKPTNKKSAFIELRSFKSFDNEVLILYFGSMLPFVHNKLNLSCKSASKPLNAISAQCYSSMLFAINIAVEQEVIRAAITIALCTLRMYTNTACSIEAETLL